MSAGLVCHSSAIAALLLDAGDDGQWVTQTLGPSPLLAPSLLPYETANVIRKHELAGAVSSDQAAQAHADLLDLTIELWPHHLLSARAWELRQNLSVYDASYVALAEATRLTLVTLDARLAGAPGIKCEIALP